MGAAGGAGGVTSAPPQDCVERRAVCWPTVFLGLLCHCVLVFTTELFLHQMLARILSSPESGYDVLSPPGGGLLKLNILHTSENELVVVTEHPCRLYIYVTKSLLPYKPKYN